MEILATAILGPWTPPSKSAPRRQQVYISLAHWFEAAKFMPHRPEVRDALLFSPTLPEVRRFARVRQSSWRPDWAITRHSVLVAGLGMLAMQRPDLGLLTCPLDLVRGGLAPMALPVTFLDTCMERFDVWRRGPRISVFGAELAPPSLVGARFAKLVSPMPTWSLVTSCNRKTPWHVHDWALTHYVPVQYIGGASERASRTLASNILAASDEIVVFEQRRHKRFDHVLREAKAAKLRVSLELYDAGDAAGGQLMLA